MAQISQEQKQGWENSLNGFGEAILNKVGTKLNTVSETVTNFVQTEASARVAADNDILSQVQAVKDLQEGKANNFYYAGDEDAEEFDAVEYLRGQGVTNYKDVTYIVKNVGSRMRTVRYTVGEIASSVELGTQDGIALRFDTRGNLVKATLDNNTFDAALANVQSDVQANYATNADLSDVASAMAAAINNAILRVNAYQL